MLIKRRIQTYDLLVFNYNFQFLISSVLLQSYLYVHVNNNNDDDNNNNNKYFINECLIIYYTNK